MNYKKELQFAFSGREIAEERIKKIDSIQFTDDEEENFSIGRKEKYNKLFQKSNEKIVEITNQINDEIDLKREQLRQYQTEYKQLNTRFKIGEISPEECEKTKNRIKKKFDQIKKEVIELKEIKSASSSDDVGGCIEIDIEKDIDEEGNIRKKGIDINLGKLTKDLNIQGLTKDHDFSIDFTGSGELFSKKPSFLCLIGSIIGIFSIFLPWLVLDFSQVLGSAPSNFASEYFSKMSGSYSLFDICTNMASRWMSVSSQYLSSESVSTLSQFQTTSGEWIQFIVLFIIIIGVSFISNTKIKGIGHILLAIITLWLFFGIYQQIQTGLSFMPGLSHYDYQSWNQPSAAAMNNIISFGFGIYIMVIGLIMIFIGGINELRR